MKQLPKGIYDICDFEVARCDLVKHRCEQEKVISANETNLYRLHSRQQLLKMKGGINPAETTAKNDDAMFAPIIRYRIDHRVLSEPDGGPNSNLNWPPDYSGDSRSLFVSSSFACATSLGRTE
jgi:hypothetical protein